MGDKLQKKITLTIAGNSLHFHRDRNFWFEATFTLPPNTDPKQLHAIIKARPSSQAVSIGRVVRAFFKLEDGTLSLATIADEAEETPKSFEAAGTRYELRKVKGDGNLSLATIGDQAAEARSERPKPQPQRTYTQPPKREKESFRFEVRPSPAGKSEK